MVNRIRIHGISNEESFIKAVVCTNDELLLNKLKEYVEEKFLMGTPKPLLNTKFSEIEVVCSVDEFIEHMSNNDLYELC